MKAEAEISNKIKLQTVTLDYVHACFLCPSCVGRQFESNLNPPPPTMKTARNILNDDRS